MENTNERANIVLCLTAGAGARDALARGSRGGHSAAIHCWKRGGRLAVRGRGRTVFRKCEDNALTTGGHASYSFFAAFGVLGMFVPSQLLRKVSQLLLVYFVSNRMNSVWIPCLHLPQPSFFGLIVPRVDIRAAMAFKHAFPTFKFRFERSNSPHAPLHQDLATAMDDGTAGELVASCNYWKSMSTISTENSGRLNEAPASHAETNFNGNEEGGAGRNGVTGDELGVTAGARKSSTLGGVTWASNHLESGNVKVEASASAAEVSCASQAHRGRHVQAR